MANGFTEESLKEFYQHVYPCEDVVQWLSYNLDPEDTTKARAAEGYLARREFCFTLLGDIFTRFRSYSSVAELRQELVNRYPEKIDVGAVYNVRPNQKQQTVISAVERELVFDIDMSDYDKVRSCCQGKSICRLCWSWMSTAAGVLRHILRDDFGFRYMLPIFSGRRGIHLWVCDKRARRLADDERAALVGYMTVFQGDFKTNITQDLVNGRPIHPTLVEVQRQVLQPAFEALFLTDDATNPNSVMHPKGAAIVFEAISASVKQVLRREVQTKFFNHVGYEAEGVLEWGRVVSALGDHAGVVVASAQFMLLYPRLDVHVSTHRDHLLKLPYCVHPGTGRLCCPLRWGALEEFDPIEDAPTLNELLMSRQIDPVWRKPLMDMLADMRNDEAEL